MKLLETSELYWHNLLKNPEDLPKWNFNSSYLCMVAFPEDIEDNENITAFCITDGLYVPAQNKWYFLGNEKYPPMDDVSDEDEPPLELTDEEFLSAKYNWIEPAGKVVMWAEATCDYVDYAKKIGVAD